MEGFKEGFEFFSEHASEFGGMQHGEVYVDTINHEIDKFMNDMTSFKCFGSDISTLKGDVAEFWHADTFNIKAALNASKNRVEVPRSHGLGSVDIQGKNFEGKFGLKYYKTGSDSAKAQSKSILEAYKGNRDAIHEGNANAPLYGNQIRVIPSDQMKDAINWLNHKIEIEKTIRPEQVERYQRTLDLLRDRVSDNKGNESIPLTEEDARELARLAKEGNIDLKKLGLSTEELINYELLLKQSFKSGLTAAVITLVLKTAPEIINAFKYLIDNGEIEEDAFKNIGLASLKGASEGFVRGTVSASITIACQSGILGNALENLSPSVIGAVTVLAVETVKNSYLVSIGRMSRYEMTNELIRTMFVSTCALIGGGITQGFIQIPILGYMIGNFAGSVLGSFIYSAVYKPVMSFFVDTGFTMFGLVDQNYQLPSDVMENIGIEVFDYDRFNYDEFQHEQFTFNSFETDSFVPVKMDITFLRRGVIGINQIGYV